MPEAYVFEYEVTDATIAEAAEAYLVAGNAGQPPRRVRSLVIAESLICLQILIGLVVAVLVVSPTGSLPSARPPSLSLPCGPGWWPSPWLCTPGIDAGTSS